MKLLVSLPLVLGVGCIRDVETVFPEGLEPLENNVVGVLWADADDGITFVSGEDDGLHWVHGRGMVFASPRSVVDALFTPAVVQDRRGVDEWQVEMDVESGYDASFAILNTKVEILTVEWTLTWRGLIVEGTADDPDVVALRYQKTDGVGIIDVMRGSIVARRVADDRTEIELIQHLQAPLTSEQDLLCYQQDLFDEVVLTTRGEALPEYTETCR